MANIIEQQGSRGGTQRDERQVAENPAAGGPSPASATHVFRELGPGAVPKRPAGLGRIQEVPVQLSAELGRASVRLRDLLQLARGAVIELDRLAGEPVDVFINERLVAQGEVVTVNAKRGVRFTDIITPDERLPRGD